MDPGEGQDVRIDEDTSLPGRFREGDMSAFRCVYERHSARVHGIVLRLSGDPSRAEDLTQEAFLHAWRARRSLRNGTSLGAWIRRIAVNTALTSRRGELRRLHRELRMPEAWDAADTAGGAGPELALDLETAVARLPAGARTVYVLHDVEGYTHTQIGRMLKIAPGTSKAHLHRARGLLRKEMER